MKFALGRAVPRTEDPRLLTGRGRYTIDFVLPRLTHADDVERFLGGRREALWSQRGRKYRLDRTPL